MIVGCAAETLRQWVRPTEVDRGLRPGVSGEERDRLKPFMLLYAEHHLIEARRVTISRPANTQRLHANLADCLPQEVVAEGLPAPLAGDHEIIHCYGRPSLGGSWKHCMLALTPLRPALARVVRGVQLEAQEDRLTRITLGAARGDTSALDYRPDR